MKNPFASSILLFGLSVTSSFARIGETMDEAVARYGQVIHHATIRGEELYSFKKNGFDIEAHFNEGKIDYIMYSKASREKLTPEEIDTFLKANDGGRPMKEKAPYFWIGKEVSAACHKADGVWRLYVETQAYEHGKIEARKRALNDQRKRFGPNAHPGLNGF
jgi:hypothetical protein